jgi:hypothetical protein
VGNWEREWGGEGDGSEERRNLVWIRAGRKVGVESVIQHLTLQHESGAWRSQAPRPR